MGPSAKSNTFLGRVLSDHFLPQKNFLQNQTFPQWKICFI